MSVLIVSHTWSGLRKSAFADGKHRMGDVGSLKGEGWEEINEGNV